MINRKTILILILFIISLNAAAQNKGRAYFAVLAFEDLRSTHGNHFRAGSIEINKDLTNWFAAGIGVKYSFTRKHEDNGWDLHKMNIVPFYINQYLHIINSKKITPFVHLQQGISFMHYHKESQHNRGKRTYVKEKGFYGYAGAGVKTTLKNNVDFLAEVGIKAFRISGNNLDVNPHGVTGKLGIVYNF